MDEFVLKLNRYKAVLLLKVLTSDLRVSKLRMDVGSGNPSTILEIAEDLERQLNTKHVNLTVLSVESNGGTK